LDRPAPAKTGSYGQHQPTTAKPGVRSKLIPSPGPAKPATGGQHQPPQQSRGQIKARRIAGIVVGQFEFGRGGAWVCLAGEVDRVGAGEGRMSSWDVQAQDASRKSQPAATQNVPLDAAVQRAIIASCKSVQAEKFWKTDLASPVTR